MKQFKFILLFFFIYLYFAFPLLGRPLLIDEISMAEFAQRHWSFANLGPGGHPPLYIDTLRLFSQFFGMHDNGLRIVGVLSFLFILVLIFQISKTIFKEKNTGILACLIFALHPMAIQGSMILDIDNTILTVLMLWAVYYFVKNNAVVNLKTGVFLTLLLLICLWAKLSTPLILMATLVLFCLLKKDLKKALRVLVISLGAILLFLLLWKINSAIFNFSFLAALKRPSSLTQRGLGGVSFSAGLELFLRILRVSLWIGVYPLILCLVIVYERFKKNLIAREGAQLSDFLIIFALGIFSGYTLIGGLSFGFAKYQYPILPILSMLIANYLLSQGIKIYRKQLFIFGVAAALLILINNFILPDPIYQINYTLRKLSIFSAEQVAGFLKVFSLNLALSLVLLILMVEAARRLSGRLGFASAFCLFSVIFILLGNFCTDIYLRKAPFFTTYCYGRSIRDFQKAVSLCKDIASKDSSAKIIAPEDVLYASGIKVFKGYEQLWNNRDKFLELIEGGKVAAIIYGFTYNAVFSYRNIFLEAQVLQELKNKYRQKQLGEYTVWERKGF